MKRNLSALLIGLFFASSSLFGNNWDLPIPQNLFFEKINECFSSLPPTPYLKEGTGEAMINGVIDPVLEMDWTEAMDQFTTHSTHFSEAIAVANMYQSDLEALMKNLEKFDEKTLGYLAMEVAREFADFHSREDLH